MHGVECDPVRRRTPRAESSNASGGRHPDSRRRRGGWNCRQGWRPDLRRPTSSPRSPRPRRSRRRTKHREGVSPARRPRGERALKLLRGPIRPWRASPPCRRYRPGRPGRAPARRCWRRDPHHGALGVQRGLPQRLAGSGLIRFGHTIFESRGSPRRRPRRPWRNARVDPPGRKPPRAGFTDVHCDGRFCTSVGAYRAPSERRRRAGCARCARG